MTQVLGTEDRRGNVILQKLFLQNNCVRFWFLVFLVFFFLIYFHATQN